MVVGCPDLARRPDAASWPGRDIRDRTCSSLCERTKETPTMQSGNPIVTDFGLLLLRHSRLERAVDPSTGGCWVWGSRGTTQACSKGVRGADCRARCHAASHYRVATCKGMGADAPVISCLHKAGESRRTWRQPKRHKGDHASHYRFRARPDSLEMPLALLPWIVTQAHAGLLSSSPSCAACL
jgi:hypothetical protein